MIPCLTNKHLLLQAITIPLTTPVAGAYLTRKTFSYFNSLEFLNVLFRIQTRF